MIVLPATGVSMGYFGGAGLPFFFTKFTPASGKCFPSDSPPLATSDYYSLSFSFSLSLSIYIYIMCVCVCVCVCCLCVVLKVSLAKPRTENSQDSRMAFTSKLDKFLSKCVRSKTRSRGPQFLRRAPILNAIFHCAVRLQILRPISYWRRSFTSIYFGCKIHQEDESVLIFVFESLPHIRVTTIPSISLFFESLNPNANANPNPHHQTLHYQTYEIFEIENFEFNQSINQSTNQSINQ